MEITQNAQVLGSVIGSSDASKNFLKDAEIKYTEKLNRSCQFALTSPQNAYACLTKAVQQTEFERLLAYYSHHGQFFGQGGGAA